MGAIERTLAGDARVFDLGGRKVEVYYPGPGHTVDNAVAYDPASRVLFGGCMIRAAATTDLGNAADAVVAEWAGSVGRVAARYSEAAIVIPGHGDVGGRGLLAHTVKLISAAS